MKIVCENCGAKYSIADEKVKGKVFKIRCKKCSESIVVRGTSDKPAAAPQATQQPVASQAPADDGEAETKVFDYAGYNTGADDVPIWHIVTDEQQQGPYTQSQVNDFIHAGNISTDSLIWREGFDDWMPVSEVAEFSSNVSAHQPAAVGPAGGGGLFDSQPAGPAGGGGLFDAQPQGGGLFDGGPAARQADPGASPFDSGGGLFGDSGGSAAGGEVFSSAKGGKAGGGLFDDSAAKGGGGLFGGGAGSPAAESGDEGIFSSTKAPVGQPAAGLTKPSPAQQAKGPRVSQAQAMLKGQRNENSVLFSLSNLQALAAAPAPNQAPAASTPVSVGMPGPGGIDEGSGLIDIRSLAGSLSTAEQDNSVDDLISMGSGSAFAPALGAPVLATQEDTMSSSAKTGIIVGIVSVLVAVVIIAVVFLVSDDDEAAAQAEIAALQAKLREAEDGPKSDSNAEAIAALKAQLESVKQGENTSTPQLKPLQKDTPSSSSSSSSSSGSSSSKKRRSSTTSTSKKSGKEGSNEASSGSSESSSSSSSSASSAKPKSNNELDDLLGGGAPSRKSASPAPSSSSSSSKSSSSGGGGAAKASLSRDDVQRGMSSVAPAVKRCGQGRGGTITVSVQIAPTGRVSSASATGAFAGTPIGSCAARAIRRAKFPASKQNLNVKYPFKL